MKMNGWSILTNTDIILSHITSHHYLLNIYTNTTTLSFVLNNCQKQVNNDDVSFVPDQHAELDCDSGSSLIQTSVGRNVAWQGHAYEPNHSVPLSQMQIFQRNENEWVVYYYKYWHHFVSYHITSLLTEYIHQYNYIVVCAFENATKYLKYCGKSKLIII
jgi:hypothetical protein